MSDIISAKCFGCGHVVKVPGALGGKKARCPKCTNTINIPAPTDTSEDVVPDAELPEVARDDEVLDGLPVEEEPSQEPPSRETRPRPGSSPSHRRVQSGGRQQQGGRGGQPRRGGPRKGSSTGLIIGIAVGVLAVIVIVAVAASGGRKPPPPKKGGDGQEQPGSQPVREKTADDLALEEKVRDYITEFNRGNIAKAAQFYGDRAREVQPAIGRLIGEEEAKYKNFNFKSTNASTGVVTISCEWATKGGTDPNREVTFTWKNVDGTWVLTGNP